MNADIGALLDLQSQDDIADELEVRLLALSPRRTELEQVHQRAVAALAAARLAVENEERAQRELQLRVAEHRQMHERNVHQMDQVRNVREATAATSQIESARRILADEEAQLQTIARRLTDFRGIVDARESDLLSLEEAQAIARGQLDTEHAALTREREVARESRKSAAAVVSRSALSKYDRTRARRRSTSVFALRGNSCGCCDNAVPLQRRGMMQKTGALEICETCGVLLYAPD